jgi:putative transposase
VKAVGKYGHLENSVYHSDRGCQYTSETYRKLLESMNVTQSMSRKGNCWDNAVTESFFATLKVELVDRYYYQTRAIAQSDIITYIETWYNSERIHSYLEYSSPNEFIRNSKLVVLAA